MESKSQYKTGVRAASDDTPANNSSDVSDCYADVYIWNESNAINVDNSRSETNMAAYKSDGRWYHDKLFDFDNMLSFNSPGMNLRVDSYSKLEYKIIEKVTETRILWDTSYDYDEESDDISSQSVSYYDVIPNDLETFWTSFNFLTTDAEPRLNCNEIAKLDADGDGLFTYNYFYEMDEDGNFVNSDPNNRDTDGDGLTDKLEVAYETGPADTDSDDDGLTDFEEVILGTDPNIADTDGDGVSDYTEEKVPVTITIAPYEGSGSVTAQVYSDPLLADTDGDGISDLAERSGETNPASKFTDGQVRWDGNANDPSMIQELPDFGVSNEGETVTLDLNAYFEDVDGDEVFFEASIGEIDDDENWSYTFDLDDGYTVSIVIEASDLKGGTCSDDLVVYDSEAPVVLGVMAATGGNTLKGKSTADFGKSVYAETTFTLQLNETAFLAEPSAVILDGVTIKPIDRAEFDVDEEGNPLLINAEANLNGNQLTVRRFDALVENGVEYQLTIPAGKLQDASGNVTEEAYTLVFETMDTIAPKIVSVTKDVALGTPLEITFNEDVKVYSGTTIAVELLSNADQIAYLPAKKGADSKTIVAQIPSNVLSSYEDYRLHQNYDYGTDSYCYYIWVRDKGGNLYHADADTVDGEDADLTVFSTGDVTGPECTGTSVNVYGTSCYQATVLGGKIYVSFEEPIYEGEDFENIRLSFLPSLALWNDSAQRQMVKKYGLGYSCSIVNNSFTKKYLLVITPSLDLSLADLSSSLSYAVYIPEKALEDQLGNWIFSDLSYERYMVACTNLNMYTVSPAITMIASPADLSPTGVAGALINSYTSEYNFNAGQYLAVAFQCSALSTDVNDTLDVDGVSVWKLDDEGNEVKAIPVSVAHLLTLECIDTGGSPFMLVMLEESLESGCSYKLKLEADRVENAVTPTMTNEAQEVTFTTGDNKPTFSGGSDFGEDSFYGRLRAGEQLWASSVYKKYADMVGGDLTYQWYRGSSMDSASALAIEGATDLLYEPQAEDVGSYLFLELTFTIYSEIGASGMSGEDDPGETTSYSYSVMSPALGPVEKAYLTDSSINSISVMAGDTEYLAFDPDTTEYDITMPTYADFVMVDVDYESSLGSSVSINGIPAEGWEEAGGLSVELSLGDNSVIVQSRSEDYLSYTNYILNIYRNPGDGETESLVNPEAWYVKITNDDYYTGKTLSGEYEYFDILGRDEDTSGSGTAYQWYRMDSEDDESPDAIDGATAQSYTLTGDDAGKYIYFTVTPKAVGSAAGETEESWYIGPVKQIDDIATSVTGISVTYKGNELLTGFATGTKTYKRDFASDDTDSTATVTVTAGNSIEINGVLTNSAVIDFNDNDLVEVYDTVAESSYFIKLNDLPVASSVGITGDDTVEITDIGTSGGLLMATAYDQYGQEYTDATFQWTVPDGYEYVITGNYNQNLYLSVNSSTAARTINITVCPENNASLSDDQDVVLQSYVDTTAPYLLEDKITASVIDESTVIVSWIGAGDDDSPAETLKYLVYQSSSDNIDTVEDAAANGTPIGEYETDIETKEITGLTLGETFYFNVVVMDEAGNKTTYSRVFTETSVAYTVTYDANGGTGTAPTETDKSEGAIFASAENTFTAPEGKRFKEWNTASDGSGTNYVEGATVTMPAKDLTLFAIWEDIPIIVSVDNVVRDMQNGRITAKAHISGNIFEITMISCLYNNAGKMVACELFNIPVSGTEVTIDIQLDYADTDGQETLSVFFLDGSYAPVAEKQSSDIGL